MGDSALSSIFPHLYHLSSFKNYMISDFLIRFENSVSFSFGFCRHLSIGEKTEVASLLSLLEACIFREGRRDVCIWSPNPSEGFSCKSFFRLLLGPSPIGEFVSM